MSIDSMDEAVTKRMSKRYIELAAMFKEKMNRFTIRYE